MIVRVVLSLFLCALGDLIATSAFAAENNSKQYIGTHYRSLPKECRSKSGGLVFDFESLAFSVVTCANVKYIWLERKTNEESEKPSWTVIDSVALPKLKKKQEVIMGDCSFSGEVDPLIFAIGRWTQYHHGGILRNITYAVRINPSERRIDLLDIHKVQCGYQNDDRN